MRDVELGLTPEQNRRTLQDISEMSDTEKTHRRKYMRRCCSSVVDIRLMNFIVQMFVLLFGLIFSSVQIFRGMSVSIYLPMLTSLISLMIPSPSLSVKNPLSK